jgi:hypothetical protein
MGQNESSRRSSMVVTPGVTTPKFQLSPAHHPDNTMQDLSTTGATTSSALLEVPTTSRSSGGRRSSDIGESDIHRLRRKASPSPNKLTIPWVTLNSKRRSSADDTRAEGRRNSKDVDKLVPLIVAADVKPLSKSKPKRKMSKDFNLPLLLPGFMGTKRKQQIQKVVDAVDSTLTNIPQVHKVQFGRQINP